MRLLYLTPGCFDKGGISRYSRYQIQAWRETLGVECVDVLSLLGPTSEGFEEPIDVDWSGVTCSRRFKTEFVLRATALAFRNRPGIIHAAHVNMSGIAHVIARASRARSIVNTYGLEVWSGMRRDARLGLKHADLMISDCHWTARYVEDQGLRNPGRSAVIWDCVDEKRFSPGSASAAVVKRYGIPDPDGGINILSLGRMSRDAAHKGYDRLLKVFKLAAPRVPGLRLIYAGRGELADELRAQAASAGLADRTFFLGPISDKDLPDVYRSAHMFSLVSDRGVGRGEGIPLTPLEAASCGVPILVGNQDGSQEAVVDGVNGYIVDPFDVGAHASRIIGLATDVKLRQTLSTQARRRIEEDFAFEGFVAKHRAVIHRLSAASTRTCPA